MKKIMHMAGYALSAFLATSTVQAASNLLFILDSSGSMRGKLEGQSKMKTAKSALSKLIGDLPRDTKFGLMVYGHRYGRKAPNACDDIELLMPVGQATPDDIEGALKRIKPKGKTPIANALQQSPIAFAGLEKGNNNIVLISDGIETCDGNACAVAGKLAESNINVRVHVVGFDIEEKDRAQLQCIAQLGNGKYFSANSTEGFAKAVTEAVKLAQKETEPEPKPALKPAPPPPPKAPEWSVVFKDDFEGEDISANWEVTNPDPDSYVVEDGNLLVIGTKLGDMFRTEGLPNGFKLTKALPKGDWRVTVTFRGEWQTGWEWFGASLYKDAKNYISSIVWTSARGGGPTDVNVRTRKLSKGRQSYFDAKIITGPPPVGMAKAFGAPLHLRMIKKGRKYWSEVRVEGEKDKDGKEIWHKTQPVATLRPPGPLVISAGKWSKYGGTGEPLFYIDKVTVETPGQ